MATYQPENGTQKLSAICTSKMESTKKENETCSRNRTTPVELNEHDLRSNKSGNELDENYRYR